MENPFRLDRDEHGALRVGGCSIAELTAHFGTPLHVIDEERVRENCRAYLRALGSRWPDVEVVYASKACMMMALCVVVGQENLSIDVSSAGELATALASGFPSHRIVMHGSYKSTAEIDAAIGARVGRIVIDSWTEIDELADRARLEGRRVRVLLRIAPGVEPRTHPSFRTGGAGTKFGIDVGTDALEAVRHIRARPELELAGFHLHIGSQVEDMETFRRAAEVAIDWMARVARETGYVAAELDLGGGLGISYGEREAPSKDDYALALTSALAAGVVRHSLPRPRLIVEPGRSIVGDAGMTIYRTGPVKRGANGRTYVSVDGGMSDNPRPALYRAIHPLVHAARATGPDAERVTVVGKHPERDCLLEDVPLPGVRTGDLLAMLCTGAYTFSMASNYNRTPHPAVVLVGAGQADLIVRRQEIAELLANDLLPQRICSRIRRPFGVLDAWPARTAGQSRTRRLGRMNGLPVQLGAE